MKVHASRPDSEGGGKFTRVPPALRRARNRRRNRAARQARKANR